MDFFEELVMKVTTFLKVIAFTVKCSCYVLGFIRCYISLFNCYIFCLLHPTHPCLPPPTVLPSKLY